MYVRLLLMLLGIVATSVFADEPTAAEVLDGKTIRTCGDGAEWPPFHYFKRDGDDVTKEVTGFTVDLLKEIFDEVGIELEVELRAWKRCLAETAAGKYQIALDGSFNEERAETYLLSAQHYVLTPGYFFLTESNPQGVSVEKSADLWSNGSVCGLYGYNYESFGPGINNDNIDRSAKSFEELIKKTKKNRCKTFLARLEILTGFAAIGNDYLGGEFGYSALPDGKTDPFYLLISREYEHKHELKDIIDTGIARLRNEGRIQALLNSYVGASSRSAP